MRNVGRLMLVVALGPVVLSGLRSTIVAQVPMNPYRIVDGWAQLPNGAPMGAPGKVVVDPDGHHIWAVVRCEPLADPARFGDECRDSKADTVFEFSPEGKVVKSFGGGMFIWPHGLAMDREGNIYVTDAVAANRIPKGDKRGEVVVKFSPDGKVLMTLGTPGESGSGPDHFTSPSDVAVASNGDIFISDSHANEANNRVVKFSKDGKFIKAWGKTGWAPGEFRFMHAIAIDPAGRVFVGDRGNNRIQIFDQDGKSLTIPWTQFGKPSGIAFDTKDQIYVADSESDNVENPGWEEGIRIGEVKTGWVNAFIMHPWGDPRTTRGTSAEFVGIDSDGNMYAGEPMRKVLRKYVRVRP